MNVKFAQTELADLDSDRGGLSRSTYLHHLWLTRRDTPLAPEPYRGPSLVALTDDDDLEPWHQGPPVTDLPMRTGNVTPDNPEP